MRWDPGVDEALRRAASAIEAAPGEGQVVQDVLGRIVGADDLGLALLHQTWDDVTGVSSLDPRWQACSPEGSDIPGEEHPSMRTLATGLPVRGFAMGVEASTPDDVGTFVWLEIDTDLLLDEHDKPLGVMATFRDVSETPAGRRATQRLIRSYRTMARESAAQSERLRAMVESSSDVILEAGTDGTVQWASPSVREVLGWDPERILGTPVVDLVHHLDRETARARARALMDADETSGREELRLRTADGDLLWMNAVWRVMRGPKGEDYGVLVSFRDVHADVVRREALAHMAHHDGLTGLLNRDSAYAWLRAQIAQSRLADRGLAVLYVDVDHFKGVNDTYGHAVGDRVLAAVARVLSRAVRDDDMVARTGGDEFVLALRASPDISAVEHRASAVLDGVRSLRVDDAGPLSVSVGLVRDDGIGGVDDLVRRADEALFRAKNAGRDRFSW